MVYYSDKSGRVLSVEELENNSDILNMPNLSIDTNINPFLRSKNYLTKELADFFESKEDNKDVTKWSLDYDPKSTIYTLPNKSTLSIVYDKRFQQNSVVVNLSEESKGNLNIPLVPVYAVGELEFLIGNKKIKVLKQYRFSEEESIDVLMITKVTSSSKIYYKLNPKLDLFDENNRINILSSDSLRIATSYNNLEILDFADSYFLLNKYRKRHFQYLKFTQNIKDSEEMLAYLLREYEKFLSLDETCDKNEQVVLIENFKKRYNDLIECEHVTKTHLQDFYPILVFNIFITERYGDLGDLYYYHFD
jgi:hypothetical protein